jgi:hypothetical protein
MIRITYRLIMDAPDPRQTRRILVRFSTGMEVAADLDELEKLADCLDIAANGGYREIRGNDGATLTIRNDGQAVHLKRMSASGIRTLDLSRPMAQQLAADLRVAYHDAGRPPARQLRPKAPIRWL